jgi:hypothetical protein
MGVGAVALTMAGFAFAASPAQAAENVTSSYQLGCTLYPEDSQNSSQDPAGVSFSGLRQAMSASPESHTLYGRSLSLYPPEANDTGEDCDGLARWGDRLTVGAGTSGAAEGDLVPVTVHLTFDGELYEYWDADGRFLTNAHYDAELSVVSLDDCEYSEDDGANVCDTPVRFTTEHEHEITGERSVAGDSNGSIEVQGVDEHSFTTNTGFDDTASTSEDGLLCEDFRCDPATHHTHPDGQPDLEFTATANLRVGSTYSLDAKLNMLSQAYYNIGVQGEVNVDEFSLAIAPAAGAEGVVLDYASDGTTPPPPAPDTTAPVFHGVQDITVPAGPDGTAVVDYPFTVDDDVDATPTVTCTPPSGSRFASRSYPVLCRATDDAGNTSEATFTVRLTDELPPVIGPMPDLTATATVWGTAVVNWTVPASDNLGSVSVSCTPPSGTAFPVGATRVTCVATDEVGLTASRSFSVTVAPNPGAVFDRLYEVIRTSHTNAIYKSVLLVSVRVIDAQYDRGNTRSGCVLLGLLDNAIRSADGRAIPTAEAQVMESLVYEARYKYNCHS